MRTGGEKSARSVLPPAWCFIVGVVTVTALADTAAAQGFFEMLFGSRPQPAAPAPRAEPQQPRSHSYADPRHDSSDPTAFFRRQQRRSAARAAADSAAYSGGGYSGGTVAFCVRLCDGRYFPLQAQGEIGPTDICQAFCPAARTKILYGNDIGAARAHDGTRYASLSNAFVYRERLVADCTCNGKTPYGLATIDPRRDPTLRPGDMIATKDGLIAYRGRGSGESAQFTPLDKSRPARERLGASRSPVTTGSAMR